jgi:SAM-dependent methyltransferase
LLKLETKSELLVPKAVLGLLIFDTMERKEWFAEWFDTPYYHILYKHRDHLEAEKFITRLCSFLKLDPNSNLLDLACGKGRHALMLNKLGYQVLGADLSPQSIAEASRFSNDRLQFTVHDMRDPIENKKFNCIFNLFTSFGYFNSKTDNLKVLESIHSMLLPNGLLVIDFMNAEKVIRTLVGKENKTIDGVSFDIERHADGQHIFKDIRFTDQGHSFHYTERVQSLKLLDFKELLEEAGFNILHTFGDFELNAFDAFNSDRLIIIAARR